MEKSKFMFQTYSIYLHVGDVLVLLFFIALSNLCNIHKNYSCSSRQPSEAREAKCQSASKEVKSRSENGDLHKQQYIPTHPYTDLQTNPNLPKIWEIFTEEIEFPIQRTMAESCPKGKLSLFFLLAELSAQGLALLYYTLPYIKGLELLIN